MISDRMLWVAADGKTIVEDRDRSAAILLTGPGKPIPDEDVRKFGLSCDADGRVVQLGPAAEPEASKPEREAKDEPEVKERDKPADKAAKKPANKRRRKRAT